MMRAAPTHDGFRAITAELRIPSVCCQVPLALTATWLLSTVLAGRSPGCVATRHLVLTCLRPSTHMTVKALVSNRLASSVPRLDGDVVAGPRNANSFLNCRISQNSLVTKYCDPAPLSISVRSLPKVQPRGQTHRTLVFNCLWNC